MSRQLLFVHGRAQQGKDATVIKEEWLAALNRGLGSNHPPLGTISASQARIAYYGNTLDQMAMQGKSADEAEKVILRGDLGLDEEAQQFLLDVLNEIKTQHGISDADVEQVAVDLGIAPQLTDRGVLDHPWIRAILQTLDKIDGISAFTIAQATKDVYQYLTNNTIRTAINPEIAKAITSDTETVVVGHSLGSVVAYLVLHEYGADRGWSVPLFVTVGSPLAVNAVQTWVKRLVGRGGNNTPACVSTWFNAMDPLDPVALYPLDPKHFRLTPPDPCVENKTDVKNPISNRHGIDGYLSDAEVAKRICEAL